MQYEGDNMSGLRRNNRAAVLRCLQEQDGLSRKRLSELLGLTQAAITKIVSELIGEGLVREGPGLSGAGAGRREVPLHLAPRSRCALGVLLGLGEAVLSAAWLDGETVFSETVTLPQPAPAEATVRRLARRLMSLAARHRLSGGALVGIGIAVRGVIGEDDRTVRASFGALDTPDYPICDRFEQHTGLRCVLSNNVRALLSAQFFLTRPRDESSCFFLRCGSGIGAALSLGGRIWPGDRRQCAEIGHIPVVPDGGKPCHCGKTGCLETIASPAAIRGEAVARLSPRGTPLLWRLSQERGADGITVWDVLDAARDGDPGACAVVGQAVKALASALKSVIYLLDPGRILLYGGIFDRPDYLSLLSSEMETGVDPAHAVSVEKSSFNGKLENKAACLLMAESYLENGGVSE